MGIRHLDCNTDLSGTAERRWRLLTVLAALAFVARGSVLDMSGMSVVAGFGVVAAVAVVAVGNWARVRRRHNTDVSAQARS